MRSTCLQSFPVISTEMTPASAAADANSTLRMTRAIASGDADQFQVFYDRYAARLGRFFLLLSAGDEEVSQELQQAVLLKAATKMRPFDTEEQLWAWLSEIARNAWRDSLRSKIREQKRATALSDPSLNNEAALDDAPLFEWLECELEQLDESDRELIRRFYFEEISQKEIAQQTGRTSKAIEGQLARIRKKLRHFLLRRLKDES